MNSRRRMTAKGCHSPPVAELPRLRRRRPCNARGLQQSALAPPAKASFHTIEVMPPSRILEPARKTVLSSGLTVVSETVPWARSVSLGVWLDAGSRHEPEADSGITHFTEHMVFKGTERFSARDIAHQIDGIGGHLDAFTSKEMTAFTARVLDEHWPRAFEVVSDMVQNPTLDEADIEREKGVVLEELKMDEDNPDFLLDTVFARSFWREHAMGRPVIGNAESIRGFRRGRLRSFFKETFRAPRILLAAAGNIDHDTLAREAERRLAGMSCEGGRRDAPAPQAHPAIVLHDKPSLEQVHISVGFEAFCARDPRRFAGALLSTLLGGGFSSRLFQKIREEAGLAYSVYSDLSLFSDAGCLSIGAGTSREAVPEVLARTFRELRDLKDNLVPEAELRRVKEQVKGNIVLGLESMGSRMASLARQMMLHGEVRPIEDIHEAVEAVTARDMRGLARQWFQRERVALCILGDLQGLRVSRGQLDC